MCEPENIEYPFYSHYNFKWYASFLARSVSPRIFA